MTQATNNDHKALPPPAPTPTDPLAELRRELSILKESLFKTWDLAEARCKMIGDWTLIGMMQDALGPLREELGQPVKRPEVTCQNRVELGNNQFRLCGLPHGHKTPHEYSREG